jgi:hypothetical protein
VVNVAAQSRYGTPVKGVGMKTSANRNEPKVQALTWLVSQLRWEETLGDLRHSRFDDNDVVREAA